MSDYLGLGDRLSSGPSEELAIAAFGDELRAARYLWRGMSEADLAHALALSAAGVIDGDTARQLLDALLELDHVGVDEVDLDPRVGDVYNNRDRLLKESAPDAVGHLHAGRARREATTIGWLLECRHALLGLGPELGRLATVLADVAGQHTATVMPDFTYLHRAQPTSLGHYLLAHAWPCARHLDRLQTALETLSHSCPAGSGSVNGTQIPLDRDLLAHLLGFEGVMWHTRDSMWAPDLVLDLAGLCVQIMTSIDRLAEELQLWTTEAFGFTSLADRHCRTSVIMPHKKNPYALTHLRGAARRTTGLYGGVAASMQTASGQPDNRTIAYHDVPFMLEITRQSVRLLAEVVGDARFDTDALAAAGSDPFMASTELCDLLTLEHGLSNRTAHRIIGRAVRDALESETRTISAALLSEAALEHGIELNISEDTVATALEPATIVSSRTTHGGASSASVNEMCSELRRQADSAVSALLDHPAREFGDRLRSLAARHEPSSTTRNAP